MTKTIRISEDAYKKLLRLEKIKKSSKQEVIDRALENLIREDLFARANEAYLAYDTEDKREQEEWEIASLHDLRENT